MDVPLLTCWTHSFRHQYSYSGNILKRFSDRKFIFQQKLILWWAVVFHERYGTTYGTLATMYRIFGSRYVGQVFYYSSSRDIHFQKQICFLKINLLTHVKSVEFWWSLLLGILGNVYSALIIPHRAESGPSGGKNYLSCLFYAGFILLFLLFRCRSFWSFGSPYCGSYQCLVATTEPFYGARKAVAGR